MADVSVDARVALLGPLEVEVDGRRVEVTSGHQRRLVSALALDVGRPVSTDRLVAVLWGDDPPPSAINSLQSHLTRLRRTLGSADLVQREGVGYRLAIPADCVDAARFEALVAEASTAGAPGERLAQLDEALSLWRGDDLVDLEDGPLHDVAVRLVERRLIALTERASAALDAGSADRAVEDLQAVLARQPLRETAVALLVRALAAAGRTADADTAFQTYRARLADELGLDPSAALQDVHGQLLRGHLERVAPATSSARWSRARRPRRPRTPFVGRAREVAAVSRLLDSGGVVTLVGPGGVGKTRTAMEVVHHLPPDVMVFWVDLADARVSGDVAGRVALQVGTATPRDVSDLDLLAAALGLPPRVVLVLDDCEPVAEDVADLVDGLLATVEGLRVLATSRGPLHAEGERVLRLGPLPTDAGPGDSLSTALALFADRAGGRIDLDDARQVQLADDVVRGLDGLPLALELAARQVANLGLVALHERLDQRLDLLRTRRRPEHPAHHGLRELVTWSTDLLDEVRRSVFRRLGIFSGVFTLSAAEAVAADDRVPRASVPAALADLVEGSLVTREGELGFRLLESLRVVAREELAEHGEMAEVERRHARGVIEHAEAAARRLTTEDEPAAVQELHRLVPDLQAVSQRAVQQSDVVVLSRLAAALHLYAYHTQRLELLAGARVAAELVRAPEIARTVPDDLLVHLWSAAAAEANARGDRAGAQRLAEQAVGLAEGPSVERASAWDTLADIRLGHVDPSALEAYTHVVDDAAALGIMALEVNGWLGIALVGAYTGDHTSSRHAIERVEALAARCRAPSVQAWAAYGRGEAEADRDPEAALTAFARAVDHAHAVDNHLAAAAATTGAAAVRARHGDPRQALIQLHETLARCRRAGGNVQASVLRNAAVLLARIGQDEPAATLIGATVDEPLYPAEQRRVAVALDAVTGRLGTARVQQLADGGRAMSGEELIALALGTIDAALAKR